MSSAVCCDRNLVCTQPNVVQHQSAPSSGVAFLRLFESAIHLV